MERSLRYRALIATVLVVAMFDGGCGSTSADDPDAGDPSFAGIEFCQEFAGVTFSLETYGPVHDIVPLPDCRIAALVRGEDDPGTTVLIVDGRGEVDSSFDVELRADTATLTPDGDLLLAGRGTLEDDDEQVYGTWLVAVDLDGATVWQRCIGESGYVGSLTGTPNGGFALSLTRGCANPRCYRPALVARVDAGGEVEMIGEIPDVTGWGTYYSIGSVDVTADGGVGACGTAYHVQHGNQYDMISNHYGIVAKFAEDGTLDWKTSLQDEPFLFTYYGPEWGPNGYGPWPMRCVEMPDGRSRAVGRLYLDTGDAYGDWQSWELRIFVVDFHEGELTGAIPLDEFGYWSETRDITLLPDGSIAAVGWIRPSLQQAGSPTVRPLVLGLDPDGGLEWRETFDFGGKAGTVSAYPGGGLLVGGETEDRGFLIRTDEVGEL